MLAWLKVQASYVREVEASPTATHTSGAGTGVAAVHQGHQDKHQCYISTASVVILLPVYGTGVITSVSWKLPNGRIWFVLVTEQHVAIAQADDES